MNGLGWVRAKRNFRNATVSPVSTPVRTRHKGVVHTVTPCTIYLDGNTAVAVPAHTMGHYTLTVGAVVKVDNVDGDLVVDGIYAS